jgi:hypothetical protein
MCNLVLKSWSRIETGLKDLGIAVMESEKKLGGWEVDLKSSEGQLPCQAEESRGWGERGCRCRVNSTEFNNDSIAENSVGWGKTGRERVSGQRVL